MEFLNVRGNKIKDMFPFWLGSLQYLVVLELRSNALYGPVYDPSAYFGFRSLRIIDISNNSFVGSLPQDYFANWTDINLSRNNLSGKIPQSLGNLSFLSNINFSHNHLQGLVPQSTQFGTQKCSSFMGNPGLYGLEKICKDIHAPIPTSHQPKESSSESEEQVVNWIAAAIAFGPAVFCGLVIGYIFTSYKHEWFMAR